MIEITTTETAVTVTSDNVAKAYPKNSVRFNLRGDEVHFRDTATDRDIANDKITNIKLNDVTLTSENAEENLLTELF